MVDWYSWGHMRDNVDELRSMIRGQGDLALCPTPRHFKLTLSIFFEVKELNDMGVVPLMTDL